VPVLTFQMPFAKLPRHFLSGQIAAGITGAADSGLSLDPGGQRPDPFHDDQSLILRTEQGIAVLLGCCHAGLCETLQRVVALTGDARIAVVAGGTHLGFCNEQHLETTVAGLGAFGVKRWYPAHCTGQRATFRLQQSFPGAVVAAQVGTVFEL